VAPVLCALLASVIPASIAYADLDTTPPVATLSVTGTLGAPQRVSFNEDVIGVSSDNVVLAVRDPAAAVAASLRCYDASTAAVNCAAGLVRMVTATPSSPIVPGQSYTLTVNPSGATTPIVDGSGNAAATAARTFLASVVEQETSPAATYVWRTVADANALDGSYQTEREADAQAVFRFTGTSATWYTKLGPGEGRAKVTIDGTTLWINNYKATTVFPFARRFANLPAGPHVLVVVVLGQTGAAAATGTWVAVDAMRVGSGPLQDATYRWRPGASSHASGGRFVTAGTPGARVKFTFRGQGIDWFTITGPNQGMVKVFIDGRFVKLYDNYSPGTLYGVRRTLVGLSDTVHTLMVMATGTRNRASSGTQVALDRWVLRAGISVFRKLGTWIDLFDYTDATTDATIQSRVADMQAKGVKTIYVETGRYNTGTFLYPAQIDMWLARAHAAGLKVAGWYFPAYSEFLSGDIAKTAAIASYISPAGQRFDGLAIDIEYRGKNSSKTEFFNGITSHLAGVRARVGLVYPVGAITFAPLDMDIWPAGWDGFPWAAVGKYANVEMPMGYWSNRDSRCASGQTQYCPYQYTLQNIQRSHNYTGLPVHDIGGVANAVTTTEVTKYVQGARDGRAIGGGLYDYRTTAAAYWTPLAGLNSL
jgi:hypothetical protein